jgi:hypothetical protein
MIRKMPLILAGMAALALALPIQSAAAAVTSGSGATFKIVPSPNPGTFPTLLGVGASSASDAWTVGYYADSTNSTFFSLAEHWNGSAWAVVSTPNPFGNENVLSAVADLSPANVWAVGHSVDTSNYYNEVTQPLIEHWNGTRWSAVPAATDSSVGDTLSGVAAVSATDVWAVGSHFDATIGGSAGLIEHWNGTRWSIVPSPTSASNLTSVAVISSSDVWVTGEAGLQPIFEHWNGKTWSAFSGPPVSAAYVAVTGITAVSSTDVWAVGTTRAPGRRPAPPYQTLAEHWDGQKWSIVASPDPVAGNNVFIQAAAISGSDVWAVGYDYGATGGASPLLANWDGTKWNTVQAPVPSGTQYNQLAAAAALPTGTVWAVGRSDYEDLIINTSNG